MFQPYFYMMTPALQINNPVEIICVRTEHNLNALLNWRRSNPHVGIVSISEQAAYKVLAEYGQAGIGCFIGDDACGRTCHKLRKAAAMLKARTFKLYAKGFDIHEAYSMAMVKPSVRRVAREILTLTFSRKN